MKDYQKEIFGYIATFFVISINVPLCFKVYRTKSTGDLSMTTFILTLCAGIFYLIYGLLINNWPLIICNIVVTIITIFLIYFKFKYDNNNIQNKSGINIHISSI